MVDIFNIGTSENHKIEIGQKSFGRMLVIKVDDEIVASLDIKPFKFSYTTALIVGVTETHKLELHVNFLISTYKIYLDGELFKTQLLPFAIGYNHYVNLQVVLLVIIFSCLILPLLMILAG